MIYWKQEEAQKSNYLIKLKEKKENRGDKKKQGDTKSGPYLYLEQSKGKWKKTKKNKKIIKKDRKHQLPFDTRQNAIAASAFLSRYATLNVFKDL